MGFTIAEELLKTSKIRERILIYHTGMTEISKPEGFLCGIHHLDGEGATPAFITALHTTPGLMLRLCADIIFFFFCQGMAFTDVSGSQTVTGHLVLLSIWSVLCLPRRTD